VYDENLLVDLSTQNYTYLCATVTICATLADLKFDLYILTPVTLKSTSNQRWICQFTHFARIYYAQLATVGQ